MAKRFDPIVKYEGRDYNVLEIPENNTALVKEHEDLVLASADLESLVRDLSLVGKFIRIAYNGVAGYTDLQIKVRRVGINVSKLCNESTNLVWQFKLKSRTVLEDLQSTYQFLSDGMEDIALGVLQSTATEAQGMAEAAKKLAQAFEEESGRVEDAHEDTLKTKAAEKKRKDDLDEEKKRAEIEKARAVTENTGVEQDLAFQEQQYARADARYAIESRDDGFFDAIHNFFTGRKDERIRVARQDMERHLQEISDLRKSRSKLLQDIAEFSKKMENCQEESVLTEAAIKSLHSAIGGLKGLSNIMRKIADFWKKLETHCKELGGEKMRKLMEVAMKRPKEERAEVWGTDAFKMQAMHYYARWVALGNICGVAYERMKVTQSELYEYLEENLTTEEARRNVRKLAATFSKELEMAIEENKTQEQREKTALTMQEESFSSTQLTLVKQIMTSEHVGILRVMSINASNMATHLYKAEFIGDSTNRYIATSGIPEEKKAVKLLQDCTTHITTHPQPVERMKELLEILCEEPAGKFVAEKINKQLSTLQAK